MRIQHSCARVFRGVVLASLAQFVTLRSTLCGGPGFAELLRWCWSEPLKRCWPLPQETPNTQVSRGAHEEGVGQLCARLAALTTAHAPLFPLCHRPRGAPSMSTPAAAPAAAGHPQDMTYEFDCPQYKDFNAPEDEHADAWFGQEHTTRSRHKRSDLQPRATTIAAVFAMRTRHSNKSGACAIFLSRSRF